MKIKPCELKDANALIERIHRHHKPVVGHRFSIRVVDGDETRGVAVVGRPVARAVNQRTVLEVTRLATDGTSNVCSMLYSAEAARIGREMGYEVIQTYVLETEHGTSLKASGWERDPTPTAGGAWKRSDGAVRRTDQPACPKWSLHGGS